MLVALWISIASVATAQTSGVNTGANTVQSLMRRKLEATQSLLAALVIKDFNGIKVQGEILGEISKATTWYKGEDPDFVREAASFRNSVEFLQQSAATKDVASTSLGFVRLTLSCMACHNFVRDVKK